MAEPASGHVSLAVWTAMDVTADDVLKTAAPLLTTGDTDAAALVSSVTRHLAARVDDSGQLVLPGAAARSVSEMEHEYGRVWELCAFGNGAELRWQRTDAGRAVLLLELADDDGSGPGESEGGVWEKRQPLEQLEPVPARYLLWGETLPAGEPDWVRVGEARVGSHDIPLRARGAARVVLQACEYLAVDHVRDGNVGVVEERLVGFTDADVEGAP